MPNTLRKLREQISHIESKLTIEPTESLCKNIVDEQKRCINSIDAPTRRKVIGFKEWLNGQI